MQELNILKRNMNTKTQLYRQKPRHVPSFCTLNDTNVIKLERELYDKLSSDAEKEIISKYYEAGTIGLRRYAITHQDEVDGYIYDFSKRSTRLANDLIDRTVVTVGFTGRKKRWTLCPSSDCIPKADKREKIVGQWKILYLPPKGGDLIVPKCVYEAYSDVVDDCSYFTATLCPQQTYCAKHSNQGTFLNRNWHYTYRHQFFLQDHLVFCDHLQSVRLVWRLFSNKDKMSDTSEAELAEKTLINVMQRLLEYTRVNGLPSLLISSNLKVTLDDYKSLENKNISQNDSNSNSSNENIMQLASMINNSRVQQNVPNHSSLLMQPYQQSINLLSLTSNSLSLQDIIGAIELGHNIDKHANLISDHVMDINKNELQNTISMSDIDHKNQMTSTITSDGIGTSYNEFLSNEVDSKSFDTRLIQSINNIKDVGSNIASPQNYMFQNPNIDVLNFFANNDNLNNINSMNLANQNNSNDLNSTNNSLNLNFDLTNTFTMAQLQQLQLQLQLQHLQQLQLQNSSLLQYQNQYMYYPMSNHVFPFITLNQLGGMKANNTDKSVDLNVNSDFNDLLKNKLATIEHLSNNQKSLNKCNVNT